MYEGEVIGQVAPVEGLSFVTIPTEDFMDISNSLSDDIVSSTSPHEDVPSDHVNVVHHIPDRIQREIFNSIYTSMIAT